MRNFVTFDASFVDDTVYATEMEIISPRGKNVATAVVELLRMTGYICSEPCQHSYYGWSVDVRRERQRFWLLLQGAGEPWLLVCYPTRSVIDWLFRRLGDASVNSFLLVLHALLDADPRFTKMRWWSKEDFEANRGDAAGETPL